MRGGDDRTGELFSYVDLEARVRRNHPLRAIRAIVNEALSSLEQDFAALYSPIGRPSIPPEKLLRAMLLQAFYSIRSELMERLEYDLLFRWFVGLGIEDPVWDASTFSKNRDRLLAGEVAARFLVPALGRPLLRGRHADPGLVEHEELPPEGRHGRAAGRWSQRQPELPRRAAAQRYACLDHRPRSPAVPQGSGQGGQAQLHGSSAHGTARAWWSGRG